MWGGARWGFYDDKRIRRFGWWFRTLGQMFSDVSPSG